MAQFRLLFTPIRLGPVVVPNRIVFTAHLTNYAEDNLPSERHAWYYAERARGGCGLIITEEASVHPTDFPYEKLVHAYDERAIPGYRRITAAVHRHGAKIFAQINHNGGQSWGTYSRLPVWAPSALADPMFREVAKAMEPEDIREVVEGYARVARIIEAAGFDGAELQGSHSSLIRQFLSPATNHRQDEYGGPLENRMRFLYEVIDAVRRATGPAFALGVRLCGDELIEGGLTLDEIVEVARRLEATGQVDYLNTSIGTATQSLFLVEGSMHVPPGYSLFISSALRRAVDLPVIGVGRIKDPVQAEQILADGHADLVGMVRAQIADPEFARKSREGRVEEIRLCLSCNQECIGKMGLNRLLGCIENPAAGHEASLGTGTLRPAARPKRVMVVGGGPAGLKAAAVAARRGHRVTLWERETELGGQVNLATRVPGRAEFGDLVRNLAGEVHRLGVSVRLGCEVTPERVEAEGPDAVVVATGSRPRRPPLPGADGPDVWDVAEVLSGQARLGRRVVLVDQLGFQEAAATAEFLADGGAEVRVVTPMLYVGQDLGVTLDLELWYRRARARRIAMLPSLSVLSIESGRVRVVENFSGAERWLEDVDSVVLAVPRQADDELYFALKSRLPEVYRIGDCLAPRRAQAAVIEGERVGRAL